MNDNKHAKVTLDDNLEQMNPKESETTVLAKAMPIDRRNLFGKTYR